MAVRIAISVDHELFAEAESMAAALKVSRSQFFGMAAREYLRRHKNRRVLEELNRVYSDAPSTSAATDLSRAHRRSHRKLVEGAW